LFFAFLIGSFSTRRAGTVFAMISLGVGELIAACSIIIVAFFGGEEGVSGDRSMGPEVFGFDFAQQLEVYYLIVFWMLLSAFAMYLFSPAAALARIGLLAALGLFVALLADYLMTPALILLTKPFGQEAA
jgi:ABC-type branched-subunit amino acid transport system permease subunit